MRLVQKTSGPCQAWDSGIPGHNKSDIMYTADIKYIKSYLSSCLPLGDCDSSTEKSQNSEVNCKVI